MKNVVVLMALLAGCAGDDAPTCSEAIDNFYGNQCTFLNPQTGAETSKADALQACRELSAAVPGSCEYEFDIWLTCVGTVRGPASTEGCDCASEFDALYTCE